MLVTIEGVVNSDVCAQGERHTVEWTPHLQGLRNSGLITVVEVVPAAQPEKRPRARRRASEE
ncbi:hypothetical protein [Nocardia sp. NPDC005745]|uniref:hypothetical protein n=1 Tax=Nocardia sp. NPDC005745 TaxID=3157061 RepID=UPI0033CC45C3